MLGFLIGSGETDTNKAFERNDVVSCSFKNYMGDSRQFFRDRLSFNRGKGLGETMGGGLEIFSSALSGVLKDSVQLKRGGVGEVLEK